MTTVVFYISILPACRKKNRFLNPSWASEGPLLARTEPSKARFNVCFTPESERNRRIR
jgi:hypothetical protein